MQQPHSTARGTHHTVSETTSTVTLRFASAGAMFWRALRVAKPRAVPAAPLPRIIPSRRDRMFNNSP